MSEYETPPPVPPGPPSAPTQREVGRGLGTAGVVLVVAGAVMLAAQFVPGVRWWAAWPLVIVIAGVVQAVTPGREGWGIARLLEGLSTVAFGVAMLAWTTGAVAAGFIGRLISLWPVLLVAAGFDLLGKALRSQWIKALGSLAVIAALVYAVGVSAGGFDAVSLTRDTKVAASEFAEPVMGVTEASLELKAGVAGVMLASGDDLVSVSAGELFDEPGYAVERSGESAEVRLEMGGDGFSMGTDDAKVDARISDEVLWDLTVETGVAELDADLSDVPVRSLLLKPGVASCSIRLGDVPEDVDEAQLDVRSGISSVSIELPDGVEARVDSESGLTGHSIGGNFRSAGQGAWETPGFEQARDAGLGVWVIKVKSGIGSVDIDTY